jgi:hypothetical protein
MEGTKMELKLEGLKGTIAVVGASLSAVTLNEWVAFATLAYIGIQAFVLLEKHYWARKDRKGKEED